MAQFEYPLWKRLLAQVLVGIENACIVLRNRLLGVPEFLWDDDAFDAFVTLRSKENDEFKHHIEDAFNALFEELGLDFPIEEGGEEDEA